MPLPIETLLRMASEPVPTQTTLGADGATTTAPIDPTGRMPSVSGSHVLPAVAESVKHRRVEDLRGKDVGCDRDDRGEQQRAHRRRPATHARETCNHQTIRERERWTDARRQSSSAGSYSGLPPTRSCLASIRTQVFQRRIASSLPAGRNDSALA